MITTIVAALALAGGPTTPDGVPAVSALHRAMLKPDRLPGPIRIRAPECVGCELAISFSGIGMHDASTPAGPIVMGEGEHVLVNWIYPGFSPGATVEITVLSSLQDHDGECVDDDDCVELYPCQSDLHVSFAIVGTGMSVEKWTTYYGGCPGGEGYVPPGPSPPTWTTTGTSIATYDINSPAGGSCCGGWIKHTWMVRSLWWNQQQARYENKTVGQFRAFMSCAICRWSTGDPQ